MGLDGSGASPPNPRTGDLALNGATAVGSNTVIAYGCVNPGDGGGGIFYWDTASSIGDDGGTIIVPSAGADAGFASSPGLSA